MPRKTRYTKFYSCHHVMLRGNAGRVIFLDDVDRLRFCLILQKFGATDLEARQNMVRYTSQIIDAEVDVSIVRESNQIGALGSEEFINQFVDISKDSAITKIQLVDLIAAAQVEFGFNCSEISSEINIKTNLNVRKKCFL